MCEWKFVDLFKLTIFYPLFYHNSNSSTVENVILLYFTVLKDCCFLNFCLIEKFQGNNFWSFWALSGIDIKIFGFAKRYNIQKYNKRFKKYYSLKKFVKNVKIGISILKNWLVQNKTQDHLCWTPCILINGI